MNFFIDREYEYACSPGFRTMFLVSDATLLRLFQDVTAARSVTFDLSGE